MIKCLTIIQIKLEFRDVGFLGDGKTGVPWEKPLGAEKRTNNKLNPQFYDAGSENRTRDTIVCFFSCTEPNWVKKHGIVNQVVRESYSKTGAVGSSHMKAEVLMNLSEILKSLKRDYHRFRWYATLENKTLAETFPKFPSIIRVIDMSDRNPPITAREHDVEGHTSGCDWWISIRHVDNTYDWRKFLETFPRVFCFPKSRINENCGKREKRLWNTLDSSTPPKEHPKLVDNCLVYIYQFLTSNSNFETKPNL